MFLVTINNMFTIKKLITYKEYRSSMNQGEPGVDYDEPNLNPLVCDICQQKFDSLDKLGEHQKQAHDM